MKELLLSALLAAAVLPGAHGGVLQRGRVQMFCHRTANSDMPENTLESLALAARMGCNLVEIDIRRTSDGQLVLNHDGLLDRLTSGMGTVEATSSDELALLDAGAWMGDRFRNMPIPSFDDALAVARERGIVLSLDLKTKGEGPLILAALRRQGMLDRVEFGGEWEDIRSLYPAANADRIKSLPPDSTAAEISALQHKGYFVVVNFSANHQDMDLPAMRAAVAAGADAISVDYPRLGADAIGRPVETRIAALARAAREGPSEDRIAAVRELSGFQGFPTRQLFTALLRDSDDRVSRAAAVALVKARPRTPIAVFDGALSAPEKPARQNAAWALGMMGAPSDLLLPLLAEKDAGVLEETLLALSRCPGEVPTESLVPFLENDVLTVRGAAALALARHQPQVAVQKIPVMLVDVEDRAARIQAQHTHRGGAYTQAEIDGITANFREQMKLVQAIEELPPAEALPLLATQAFGRLNEYASMNALVAGYQLWDRIATNPGLAVQALSFAEPGVANRAEWILVKADPSVLPAIRESLPTASPQVQQRLIRILAWQGDSASLPLLREMRSAHREDAALVDWAIEKIQTLAFAPGDVAPVNAANRQEMRY